MTDIPLLPCPFCGSPAELFHDTSGDYERNWYWMGQCRDHVNCWIEGATASTPEEAAQHWNRRYDYSSERADAVVDNVIEIAIKRLAEQEGVERDTDTDHPVSTE